MKKMLLLVAFVAFCFTQNTEAQIKTPQPSPLSTISQKVGLTDVEITYSRPGVKDREIFGDLVPYGEMWRTGANASTKFKVSEDVKVGGKELKKGEYALYMTPGKEEWKVIFYKDTSHWGTPEEYKADDEAAVLMVKPESLPMSVETMTFDINNIKNGGADVMLLWDKTMVSFSLEVPTDKAVMGSIEKAMAGPDWYAHYQSARYYFENGKDINQAYEWMKVAVDIEEPRFWVLRQKSLIEAEMGNYKMAIETAKKSMEIAREKENMDYVRMNEKSIAEWSKK